MIAAACAVACQAEYVIRHEARSGDLSVRGITKPASGDLRKMLKNFGLATDEQIKGVKTKPKKIGFIDLLWDGARRKIAERSAR